MVQEIKTVPYVPLAHPLIESHSAFITGTATAEISVQDRKAREPIGSRAGNLGRGSRLLTNSPQLAICELVPL
jgi:hypothetical protein